MMTQEELEEIRQGPTTLETMSACNNAYKNASSSEDLAKADFDCAKAIGELNFFRREQMCSTAKIDLTNILDSKVIGRKTMIYAKKVINRLCDNYAMDYAQKNCFTFASSFGALTTSNGSLATDDPLATIDFLTATRKHRNTKCKNSLNSLNLNLMQEFCLNYKSDVLNAVIKRICDKFLSHLNLKSTQACTDAYSDAIWYVISGNDLALIDINCRKAVENYYGQNKEVFCDEFPGKAEINLVDTTGVSDKKILNRAIDVVKGACEMTWVIHAMNACINDHFNKYFHANIPEISRSCEMALEKLDTDDIGEFCLAFNKRSSVFFDNIPAISSLQAKRWFYVTPHILRATKIKVNDYCAIHNFEEEKLDDLLMEIEASNHENGVTPEVLVTVKSDVQSKGQLLQPAYGFFNSTPIAIKESYNVTSGIKSMLG